MRISPAAMAALLAMSAPALAQSQQDRQDEQAPANLHIEHPGEPFALSGLYRVIAQDARQGAARQNLSGREAVFTSSVQLPDGEYCEDWSVSASDSAAPEEELQAYPALAALAIGPVGEPGMFEDARLMRMLDVACEGEPLARLAQIDERVIAIVDDSSGAFTVLEQPLDREELAELQRDLAAAGFNPGPADGIMGRRTRNAIAAYAASRADVRGPVIGAVTVNLLESAGFSARD